MSGYVWSSNNLWILARYAQHNIIDNYLEDQDWSTELTYVCERCGDVEMKDLEAECLIIGGFANMNELLCVYGREEWIAEHAFELHLFPPLEKVEEC